MIFQNLVFKLTILLLNESNAPEILPYDENILIFSKELINYQKFLLAIEISISVFENIQSILKKMETDRIEYLIKTYHRIRLLKIEKSLNEFNKKDLKYNRLIIAEKKYLHSYISLCKKFVNAYFFNFIPNRIKNTVQYNIKIYNKQTALIQNTYVFFRIIKIRDFLGKNISIVTKQKIFNMNEIYCTRYKKIKRLIYSGIVFLL
jgi:GINS complex subunit 4